MFELAGYIDERRGRINRALEAVLPPETSRPVVLSKAMRYAVLSGGKRLRPILAIAAAEAVGSCIDAAMNAAISVELLHTYTLVHDDLPSMDDDDERRGKPTCHVLFGEANAILAGDALQALAFEVCAAAPAPPPYSSTQLATELAIAAGHAGVVGGQVEDVAHDDKTIDAEAIKFIHRHKTADLFRAAIRMGAIAGGGDDGQLEVLTEYAVNIGTAFQIVDDILDAEPANTDACDALSRSCVGIYGLEEAKARAEKLTTAAISSLAPLGPSARPLAAIAEHMIKRTD